MLNLVNLDPGEIINLRKEYEKLKKEDQFPLIGRYLDNSKQNSNIFKISTSSSNYFYFVFSYLGFSQIISLSNKNLEIDLEILSKNIFRQIKGQNKIRFYKPVGISYSPQSMKFYKNNNSQRQKFQILNKENFKSFSKNTKEKTSKLENNFQIFFEDSIPKNLIPPEIISRFWDSKEQFLSNSHPVLISNKKSLVSICYSAADFNKVAEIDIYTETNYRNKNYASICCNEFILNLLNKGITPNWDAFNNNIPSVNLAKKIGFSRFGNSYDFLTINKKD